MMTKNKLRHLKNEMLIANFLANFIGVFVVNALIYSGDSFANKKIWEHAVPFWIDVLFTSVCLYICMCDDIAVRTADSPLPECRIQPDIDSRRA